MDFIKIFINVIQRQENQLNLVVGKVLLMDVELKKTVLKKQELKKKEKIVKKMKYFYKKYLVRK